MRPVLAMIALLCAGSVPLAQELAGLMAAAKVVGETAAWENKYVRLSYAMLEYPAAERRVAESRPVVLYLRVAPETGVADTRLLPAPRGVCALWHPGTVPCGVRIEMLAPPPAPPGLAEPGTDLPRDAITDERGPYRLILATFQPQDYWAGTGRFPSVTVFLSDGVVEVKTQGVRRRMGVRACDAFWFEAFTRLTVIHDDAVGVAIVQLPPR